MWCGKTDRCPGPQEAHCRFLWSLLPGEAVMLHLNLRLHVGELGCGSPGGRHTLYNAGTPMSHSPIGKPLVTGAARGCRAGIDLDPVGHHERRVETYSELTNDLAACLRLVLQRVQKGLRWRRLVRGKVPPSPERTDIGDSLCLFLQRTLRRICSSRQPH